MEKKWKQWETLFLRLKNHSRSWLQLWNKKTLIFEEKKKRYDQPRQHIKKQRHYFADKGPSSQGYGFSSSHVWMWELNYKERWEPKSEFGNKEFMIWATVTSQSCLCWLYRASPSLVAKNVINLISVLTIWWCPCVESSLVLSEDGVCYDQCVLLEKFS